VAKKKKPFARMTAEEFSRGLEEELDDWEDEPKTDDEIIAETLEEERRKLVEQNNRLVILGAMEFCLNNDVPFPQWLTDAFRKAMYDVQFLKKTWADVFGDPLPKASKRKKQLSSLRRYTRLALPVYLKVREYQLQNKAADFHQIAADLPGATASIAKRVYYNTKSHHDATERMLRLHETMLPLLHRVLGEKAGGALKDEVIACAKRDYGDFVADYYAGLFSQKTTDLRERLPAPLLPRGRRSHAEGGESGAQPKSADAEVVDQQTGVRPLRHHAARPKRLGARGKNRAPS
jgi:hypothetical protein